MRRQRWWLPLLALVFTTSWKPTLTLPVPDEELDTSTKLLGSSVVTSVSVVTGSSDYGPVSSNADRSRVIPSKELPGSPADLLRPDRFQFLTLNKDGDVVTKQMSEQEIQTLIAAGGGHLPMEIHEPQNAGDVPNGGMKVADVVQNVQNVLKGELSKPATVMTSMPTIPGHANTEWSSILPAILGGESESAPVSESGSGTFTDIGDTSVVADTTLIKIPDTPGAQTPATKLPDKEPSTTPDYDSKKKPTETKPHTEKPMIQVPVITVDQKLPTHQDEEDSMPVFQMLNTISADKMNIKNNTQANDKPEFVIPQKTNLPVQDEIAKPEKVTSKPIVANQQQSTEQSNADEKLPDMVEIIQNLKKPTEKPVSMIITTENISQLPQSEPPASVSVISETHSTSMKVSGHEEIPLRGPSKPANKPADPIRLPSEEKKPEITEKPIITSSTDVQLDSTTVKVEQSATSAQESATLTTEQPSLFSQGVSFIGNLPQAVSSIVTDFISNNSTSSKPIVEEADAMVPLKTSDNLEASLGTKDSEKKPQSTETIASQTTSAPKQETVTTKKPDQEPVYQMIPEIIPNKKIPPHGASPSEASSIEHIIETLNDPTGSISGTVAADHYGIQADQVKPVSVAETSTSATPMNVESPAESSSVKPMAPLPTELADSLSSMISQISDAIPSVLPVSPDAGLDTTEKKNVIDMHAEEPGTNETTEIITEEVSKVPEEPVNRIQLPSHDELEKSSIVPTKEPETQDPTITTTSASETTEKLIEAYSTTIASVTTESVKLDSSTTVKSDLPLTERATTEAPVIKIDKIETPVDEKTEGSKPETDPVVASSEIATHKTTPTVPTEATVIVEGATKTAIPETKPVEKISTEEPATTVASSATSVTDSIIMNDNKDPPKQQADGLSVPEAFDPENPQNDEPTKVVLNENNTEMPIVHLDITEAKPTDIDNTNKSQEVENDDNGAESPFVRIQLTDPVTLVNNMIKSASVNASAGSLVPLTLPETGSVPPNSIASGLIAGFPSSTTQATPEASPNTIDFVKSKPEIQPVIDAISNSTTEDVKTSDEPAKNITKTATTETPELTMESSTTEKTNILETSTLKVVSAAETDITVQKTDSPMEPVAADNIEKEATVQPDVMQHTTTDEPKNEETINESAANKVVEVSVTPESNDQNLTKVAENVNVVSAETISTTISTTSSSKATENENKPEPTTISEKSESDDKLNEASKIVETAVSTSAKPEVTAAQTDSSETKIQDPITAVPEKSAEATNSTMSEVPIVRIDVAPETVPEEMPPKIQLTDLPIVETTIAPIKAMEEEKIQTQTSQSVTTLPTLVESTSNSNDPLQATTASSTEKSVIDIIKDKPNLEDAVKEAVKTESSAVSDSSEKIADTSMPNPTPQQTQEVRIQVNDTAVLVTKRPVSETTGQTLADTQKTTVNQPIEQSTTPKTVPVTEAPLTKLADKVERLPVPAKVSELSSSHDAAPVNTLIKTDAVSSSGTDTRIRLGEEQSNKEIVTVKIDDQRKPIKKNSDSEDKDVLMIPTTKVPPAINDKNTAHRDKDSNAQPSIKVEFTTSATFEKPPSKISGSNKLEDKPDKINDKNPPIKVTDRPNTKLGKPAHKPIMNIKKDDEPEKPAHKPTMNIKKNDEPSKPAHKPTMNIKKDDESVKPAHKPTMNIKKDDVLPGPAEEKWTLIPQQVYPALTMTNGAQAKRPTTTERPSPIVVQADEIVSSSQRPPVSLDHPQSASGLDSTVKNLETDISYFANLCNELAFTFWTATNKGLSTSRSLAVSPFGMTSMLAMVFLGARGPTSDQMNDILKLDDVSSFNPHLVFQNVTDAVSLARNQGIANAAFVRELFADRSKVRKLMPFYKEQAQQFYDGIVAEVNFATISDLVRRRTNLMIRKQTGGRIKDFVRTNTVPLRSPLAAMSANVFQTDCNSSAASSEGRDGELYFAVSPAVRQRKLVPVPATVWRAGVLAGYEPSLDATAIALGGTEKLVSTIFVIPGQQGHTAPGDTLDHLEQRFVRGATHDGAWNKLLKVLIPRPGLELQVPKFSHRSVINATAALKRMGLEELFSKHADLKGINGIATDLHLADVLQMNLFSTCGDENILSGRHHVEVYPGSPLRNAREHREFEEEKDEFLNDLADDEKAFSGSAIPYETAPHREARSARQTEATEKPRLKLDRPFLYFVRHNPTGLILHMGRFNPRLLP